MRDDLKTRQLFKNGWIGGSAVVMPATKMIYKYISFQKFVSMIETGKMYLTRIDNWEDVYEAGLLRVLLSKDIELATAATEKQRVRLIKWILRILYAQSWTQQYAESDALWRLYANDGVRIGVNRSDVAEAIYNFSESGLGKGIKILKHGSVEYSNMIPLNSEFKLEDMTPEFLRYALMYKRPAFSHEGEYRYLVYYESEFELFMEYLKRILEGKGDDIPIEIIDAFIVAKSPVLEYDFPIEKIKEVYYTPLAPKYQVTMFEAYCRNRHFDEKHIHYQQSQLYSSDTM